MAFAANVDTLGYVVGGFRDGNLYLHGVVHHGAGQLGNLGRHGGGEEDGLPLLRHLFDYAQDVVGKAHIEHTVGLVEHEVGGAAEVERAELQMGDESPGGGQHDVGAGLERTPLLFVARTIVAAVDGHGIDAGVVGKALQGLVNLPRQLPGGGNDEAVHRVGGMFVALQQGEQGQEVGGGFPCAGLGYAEHIAPFDNGGNALRLNGRAFFKTHIIECIEHIV